MFYLYKKTHAVTGMQYLGYTKKDPFVYKGSGTVWQRHISKYGTGELRRDLRCPGSDWMPGFYRKVKQIRHL